MRSRRSWSSRSVVTRRCRNVCSPWTWWKGTRPSLIYLSLRTPNFSCNSSRRSNCSCWWDGSCPNRGIWLPSCRRFLKSRSWIGKWTNCSRLNRKGSMRLGLRKSRILKMSMTCWRKRISNRTLYRLSNSFVNARIERAEQELIRLN